MRGYLYWNNLLYTVYILDEGLKGKKCDKSLLLYF